jgi:hypothetical protein
LARTKHARTIAATYRSRSRFARIRLRYPGRHPSRLTNRYPGRAELPDYNAELAIELIGGTGELPTSKRDLLIVLTHYRHALHALATQAAINRQADGK